MGETGAMSGFQGILFTVHTCKERFVRAFFRDQAEILEYNATPKRGKLRKVRLKWVKFIAVGADCSSQFEGRFLRIVLQDRAKTFAHNAIAI